MNPRRPTVENIEDNLITWREAIWRLQREIGKLDEDNECLRAELARLGYPDLPSDLNPDSLETISIEIRDR